jgi:hypothetical protein
VQHQAQRIDQDVPLLALDQLAGIKAVRIDAGAPFSAPFTLWLSITQAVGLASRSACSRHLTHYGYIGAFGKLLVPFVTGLCSQLASLIVTSGRSILPEQSDGLTALV